MDGKTTAHLVNLFVSTWPAGVRGHIWTEVLGPLDPTIAAQTYAALRDESERAVHVARFREMYRALYKREHPKPTQRPLPTDDELVLPRTGKQIAWQAYTAQCLSAGRTPDRDRFNRMMPKTTGPVT